MWWWVACIHPVPEHLRLDPEPRSVQVAPITDLTSATAAVIGRDPLGRSPYLPEADVLAAVAGAESLSAFVSTVRGLQSEAEVGPAMRAVEDDWRGTVAVPLARGYRLRVAESVLAAGMLDAEALEVRVIHLVAPLGQGKPDTTLPRLPFAFLDEDASSTRPASLRISRIRNYAERWALEGWLDGPNIPLSPLRPVLAEPQYDALRTSPVGALILARIEGAAADPSGGWADLERATTLALAQVAADRGAEQQGWAERENALRTELGETPVDTLLRRAVSGLTAAASRDRAAGGAFLAMAALRWRGSCSEQPCAGLDRVDTMRAAARWDDDVASLAACWQVLALKDALDTLDAGRDSILFPDAAARLTDALIGTGAGPIELTLLRKSRPDGQVWLTLSRSVDVQGSTTWEDARVSLGRHLERAATQAMSRAPNAELRDLLQRIARRAVP